MKREKGVQEVVSPGLFAQEKTMRATGSLLSVLLVTLSGDYACAEQMVLPCSRRLQSGTPAQALSARVPGSQADAQRTAVASLQASTLTRVTEGELELEHGRLVYSFAIRVSGRDSVEEVFSDAGTGAILSHRHESSQGETAEQAIEKKAIQDR